MLTFSVAACRKEYPGYRGKIDHFNHYYIQKAQDSSAVYFINTEDNEDTLRFVPKMEQVLSNPTCHELANDGNCYYNAFSNLNLKGPSITIRKYDNGEGHIIEDEYLLAFYIYVQENNTHNFFPDKGYLTIYGSFGYPIYASMQYPSLDTLSTNPRFTAVKSTTHENRIILSNTEEIYLPSFNEVIFDKELGIISFELKYQQKIEGVESTVVQKYQNLAFSL